MRWLTPLQGAGSRGQAALLQVPPLPAPPHHSPVLKRSCQLVLVHPWVAHLDALSHGGRRQLRRLPHQRQLSGRLAPPVAGVWGGCGVELGGGCLAATMKAFQGWIK